MDIKGNPSTRFHVADAAQGEGCPPKNSIVDVQAHFYSDIEASMDAADVPLDGDDPVFFLRTIREISNAGDVRYKPNGAKIVNEAKVVRIIPCAGEGPVGSGTPDLCCEGLVARSVFNQKTCGPMKGGYVCINCGDGTCQEELENHCNCPEDCLSSHSAQTYTIEKTVNCNTLELSDGQEVSLIGIQCPKDEKIGKEATEWIKEVMNQNTKEVRLEFDVQERDKYQRLLAYVYLHVIVDTTPDMMSEEDKQLLTPINDYGDFWLFLNGEIIKAGYAQPMTIPPNVKYADLFKELSQER